MPAVRARSLNCPNCGSPIDIHNALKAKTAVCPSCDSLLDLTSPQYAILDTLRVPPPYTGLLTLGMKANKDDKTWEIIGLIQYQWREYADGELETGTWLEFLLLSDDGRYAWIELDEEKYAWQEVITPTAPPDREAIASGYRLTLDGEHYLQIKERGTGQVVYIAGEMTWKLRLNEVIRYVEIGGVVYDGESSRWREYGIELSDDEIEFFTSEPLSVDMIYEMFSMTDHIEIMKAHQAYREQNRARQRRWWEVTAILLLGAFVCWGVQSYLDVPAWQSKDGVAVVAEKLPGPATVTRFSLSESVPSYSLMTAITLYPPADSMTLSLVSASGLRHTLHTATLTEAGWRSSSTTQRFEVPETGTWELVVEGTLNGTPRKAPAGMVMSNPSVQAANVRWDLKEHRMEPTGLRWASNVSILFALGAFFLGLVRTASPPSGMTLSQELSQATRKHHNAVRTAGASS